MDNTFINFSLDSCLHRDRNSYWRLVLCANRQSFCSNKDIHRQVWVWAALDGELNKRELARELERKGKSKTGAYKWESPSECELLARWERSTCALPRKKAYGSVIHSRRRQWSSSSKQGPWPKCDSHLLQGRDSTSIGNVDRMGCKHAPLSQKWDETW